MTASNSTPAQFATTAWSVVLRSARPDSPEAKPALEFLCKAYWQPLFEFARRLGQSSVEAEDEVQNFFAHLIGANALRYADPDRGRFRNFLLAAFRQHMAECRVHATAAKRQPAGGVVSLDAALHDRGLAEEAPPDRTFDYIWAVTLLERAMARLHDEHAASGRGERYDALKNLLTGGELGDLAAKLGLSAGASRVAVHRFRQRYADLVREEIRATVDAPGDVEDELDQLLAAVRHARAITVG